MSFKPIEPKRDEFRKYLERSGIIESLTKVFAKLINEEKRPEDPLEYIKEHLGYSVLQLDSIAHLQAELEEAKTEIQKLRSLMHNESIELDDNENENDEPDNAQSNVKPNSNVDTAIKQVE